MSLSKNLQSLRKKHNMSQEELAEKLSVSRQSISKWESGNGMPETENLIVLSEIFKTDIDTLLKGDVEENSLKKTYENESKNFALSIALGVSVIILTVAFAERLEKLANGPALFFLLIGLAVSNFIIFGFRNENFKLKYPILNFKYSNDEIIKYNNLFSFAIAFGVFNIFLGIILTTLNFPIETFLSMIALSVFIFVYFGILKSKMEFSEEKKNSKADMLCGITMIIATIIFLTTSFLFNIWTMSWIAFPIGGLICAIISIIYENKNS